MSISVDTSQMKSLVDFGYFLEVIKDPKALMAMVEEAKKVLAANEKQLGLIKTQEQADAYLQNAKDTVAKWAKEQEDKDFRHQEMVDKTAKDLKEQQERVTNALVEATRKEMLANELLQKAESDSKSAEKAMLAANIYSDSVGQKLKELQRKDKELDEKLATVKKMLGE